MVNDYGYNFSDVIKYRVSFFFLYTNETTAYKILKTIWIIFFTIPFLVTSVIELITLNAFKLVGHTITKVTAIGILAFISLLLGYIFGFIYFVLYVIFLVIFWICNFPELIYGNTR